MSPRIRLLYQPSLAKAQHSLGLEPRIVAWSSWVKLLRRLLAKGKVQHQRVS